MNSTCLKSYLGIVLLLVSFTGQSTPLLPLESQRAMQSSADSLAIVNLNQKAEELLQKMQIDNALKYALRASELARASAFVTLQANSLFIAANVNKLKNNTSTALKFYLQSKKLLEQLPPTYLLGKVYLEMGNLYHTWGLDKKAQEYYVKSHPIFLEKAPSLEIEILTKNIGEIYYNLEDYDASLRYYQKLLNRYQEVRNTEGKAEVLQKMSDISREAKEFDRAVAYQLHLLKIREKEDNIQAMMNVLHRVATIFKENHKYNKALEYYQKYLNLTAPATREENERHKVYQYIDAMTSMGLIYEEWGIIDEDAEYLNNALTYLNVSLNVIESLELKSRDYFIQYAQTYLHIARVYMRLEDYKNAVFYGHKALENMRLHKDTRIQSETYEVLVESLRNMRKFRSALRYYDKLIQMHDKLSEDELLNRKTTISTQARLNQKQFIINNTEQDIVDQELDSLTIRQLKLAAESREQELELLRTERELQNFTLVNEQLQKEKAMQDLLITQQNLVGEKKERKIFELQQNQLIQDMMLKEQKHKQSERERTIKLLELDAEIKELELDKASNEKSYYRIGIILISIILILIFANLIIARRANRKLAIQNAKIEQQSITLKEANENIKKQNDLIAKKNGELVQINKEKNQIIGIIAHDLRNPLSISLSLVDFVKEQKGDLTLEQSEGLSIINRSMQRMDSMITKILDVRAIESNKVNIRLEPIDLLEMSHRVVQDFRDLAQEKKISLQLESTSEEAFCIADQQYLSQVLENLVSNAIKFSPRGKSISLLCQPNGTSVKIGVCDEGPGLTEDDKSKLFGKFQRLSAKPTAGEQSTGLGLSIVKKYVELMQGEIWCESMAGKGATFWVELKKEQLVEA